MSYTNILRDDKTVINYRPSLNKLTGSVTATILLQQIIFRWKEEAFYKFKAPCTHRLYRKGDSWIEELGFTLKEFDGAVSKLKSSKLVSTKITQDRLTYYSLDVELLENKLTSIFEDLEFSKTTKGDLGKLQKVIFQNYKREFRKTTKGDLPILTENTTENTTNIIKNIKKEKTLNQSSKISTNLEIHLEALENYKQELLANPDKSLFISNRRSEGQIWAVDKAKAQITTICETIKEWLPTRVKKLTSNPKISLRFSQFAEGKELGWIYPEKTNSYQSNDWRDRRTKYETPDELKGY